MSRVNNSGARADGRRKASAGERAGPKSQSKGTRRTVVDRAPDSVVRRGTGRRRGHARGNPRKADVVRTVVRIHELDPLAKCGRGTSVQRLIRVDEVIDHAREAHLVFLDRHGWYCEHGPTCPAVGHARRHAQRRVRSH